MWEWALIAGVVIVGLVIWQVARGSGGTRVSRDGDAGTTFYATDSDGYRTSSTSYGGADTSNECSADTGNDGGSCDGGGGDGGGGD